MDSPQDLVHYFDELYPVNEAIKKFYSEIIKDVPAPAKILSIGSNSGSLEFFLAKQGCDVTGVENFPPLLESANLKKRTQLLAIRFFTIPENELTRFLGNGFYNIVNILASHLCFRKNREEVFALLRDAGILLAEGGKLIIKTFNFEQLIPNSSIDLPVRNGVRTKLFTTMKNDGRNTSISMKMRIWDDKVVQILKDRPVCPLVKKDLEDFYKDSGFQDIQFYSDFEKNPLTPSSMDMLCVLTK